MTTLGHVLVVDDDEAMLEVCQRVLRSEGWCVTAALDSRRAVDSLRETDFDCVVTDINMPELDGFAMVKAVRLHDVDIPVLLMTGDPSLTGAVKAIDSGAVSYLAKPFDSTTLATAVARAARRLGAARMRRRRSSSSRIATDRSTIDRQFSSALDQAWLAFQPIVDVVTKRVYAYEALIRSDEPTMARPDVLVSTAEKLDRVHELGRTVRRAAARAMPNVPEGALMFINVHGLELSDEDLYEPSSPIAQYAERVVLEITERVSVDEQHGVARVQMLRKLGYRIAIDDLGAGYSALGALAAFEPEIVKLDMGLVRDLDRHPAKRRVVGAIATLCRELGSRVVAEGVETLRELAVVTEIGVDLVQGYLLARPAREFIIPVV